MGLIVLVVLLLLKGFVIHKSNGASINFPKISPTK
jgi:hypothetical protein